MNKTVTTQYDKTISGPEGKSNHTEKTRPSNNETTLITQAVNFFCLVLTHSDAKAGRIKLANTTNTPTNCTAGVTANEKKM